MAGDLIPLEASAPVRTSVDKQPGLRWPVAIDQRLDALVERAAGAGERTDRRELLAALVAATDLSGEELGVLLKRYRQMTVAQAVLDMEVSGKVISLTQHQPGRRPRRSS